MFMFMWVPFGIFLKDIGQVRNHEIILIGNREIKRQRICHDVKTANFNGRDFKWGYSMFFTVNSISN